MLPLIEHFPYLGLFAFILLGGIGLPFPEDATLMLAGFLMSHGMIKAVPAAMLMLTGLLISDFFLFSMGRKYGSTLLDHAPFRKVLSRQRLASLEDKFRRRGSLIILLGRHFLGLRAQVFLAAGISRFPPMKFLIVDALSALITMGIFMGIGYTGGKSFQIIKQDISRIEHVSLFAAAVILFLYVIRRYIRERIRIGRESAGEQR
jgi:membrane protein DedA with SNARE-associated domain